MSPAIYDITDGKCLNDPAKVQNIAANNIPASFSPRGSELYRIGNGVVACGKPLYAHPDYDIYDRSVVTKTLLTSSGGMDVTWVNTSKIMCYEHVTEQRNQKFLSGWGKFKIGGLEPIWVHDCAKSLAVAVCKNAVIVADGSHVKALNLKDGKELWTKKLPASPVLWGMAVDGEGRVVLTLENGQIVCFGKGE